MQFSPPRRQIRNRRSRPRRRLEYETLESRHLLATFVVNSTAATSDADVRTAQCADANGNCTLRAAIEQSGFLGPSTDEDGLHKIHFNLPEGDLVIEDPLLPFIVRPVVIDGSTQPGFAGQPLVEIRGPVQFGGESFVSEVKHLIFGGRDSTVSLFGTTFVNNWVGFTRQDGGFVALGGRGVDLQALSSLQSNVIAGVSDQDAVRVRGDNNTVEMNLIGLTPDGQTVLRNGPAFNGDGIVVTGMRNKIGAQQRGNTIAGHSGAGILVTGTGNKIEGNRIGTDATGVRRTDSNGTDFGNLFGIAVTGPAVTIEDNVISGNKLDGIRLTATSATPEPSMIAGNKIGRTADNRGVLGNGRHGIVTTQPGTEIEVNTISGNLQHGVVLESLDNKVRANVIGADLSEVDSIIDFGNRLDGVSIVASSVTGNVIQENVISRSGRDGIGTGDADETVIQGNVITRNTRHGVRISGDQLGFSKRNLIGSIGIRGDECDPDGCNRITRNGGAGVLVNEGSASVLGNQFHMNSGLPIDIRPIGETNNDTPDQDLAQNRPLFNRGQPLPWQLDSRPDSPYRIEFYSSTPTGIAFAGSTDVRTDATGTVSFAAPAEIRVATPFATATEITFESDDFKMFGRTSEMGTAKFLADFEIKGVYELDEHFGGKNQHQAVPIDDQLEQITLPQERVHAYAVRVTNVDTVDRELIVTATEDADPGDRWEARYFRGQSDIRSSITGNGVRTGLLKPNESVLYAVEIEAAAEVPDKETHGTVLSVRVDGETVVEDRVRAQAKAGIIVNSSLDRNDADTSDETPDGAAEIANQQLTLRNALELARELPGPNTIFFEREVFDIKIDPQLGSLPTISHDLTIDGSDAVAAPTVLGNREGDNANVNDHGLVVTTDTALIRKLEIRQFGGHGIMASGKSLTIESTEVAANGLDGIHSVDPEFLLIGGNREEGNSVFGNERDGIRIESTAGGPSSSDIRIQGNLIGFNNAPFEIDGNGRDGISLMGTNSVLIGDDLVNGRPSLRANFISGNKRHGIAIRGKSTKTQVFGNAIGLNNELTQPIPNAGDGIEVFEATETQIGHQTFTDSQALQALGVPLSLSEGGNLIYANGQAGIRLVGPETKSNIVTKNFIGAGFPEIEDDRGNRGPGIQIDDGAEGNLVHFNQVGSGKAEGILVDLADKNQLVSNIVRKNAGDGIRILDSNDTLVTRNTVGDEQNEDRGNRLTGILVEQSSRNLLSHNTVAGNGGVGIKVFHSNDNLGMSVENQLVENAVMLNQAVEVQLEGKVRETVIQLNDIGQQGPSGTNLLNDGVVIVDAEMSTVGGRSSGRNRFANLRNGIVVRQSEFGSRATLNELDENSYFQLRRAVIDLEAPGDVPEEGVTPNDVQPGAFDQDRGPNELQNFLEVTLAGVPSLITPVSQLIVVGELKSTPNSEFEIGLYAVNKNALQNTVSATPIDFSSKRVVTDDEGLTSFVILTSLSAVASEGIAATASRIHSAPGGSTQQETSEVSPAEKLVEVEDTDQDGAFDQVEDLAANDGDGNNDQVPDKQQANVTSVLTSGTTADAEATNGQNLATVTTQTSIQGSASVSREAIPGLTDRILPELHEFLIRFQVPAGADGKGTANIHLPEGTQANRVLVSTASGTTRFVDFDQSTQMGTTFSQDQRTVSLTLEDGGPADQDGQKDGLLTFLGIPTNVPALQFESSNRTGKLLLRIRQGMVEVANALTGTVLAARPVATTEWVNIKGADNFDDMLTIDLGGDFSFLDHGIRFDGGAGGNDMLRTVNGQFDTVKSNAENGSSGEVIFESGASDGDEAKKVRVSYAGLEPIDVSATSIQSVFATLTEADDQAVLEPVGSFASGELVLRSENSTFESLQFSLPPSGITIDTGDGADTLRTSFLNTELVLVAGNLQEDADPNDELRFDALETNLESGSFTLTAPGVPHVVVVGFETSEVANAGTRSPHQNPFIREDVNRDNLVVSGDALLVINSINREGVGPLPGSPPENGILRFVDVNGDLLQSSADVLLVINAINQGVGAAEGERVGTGPFILVDRNQGDRERRAARPSNRITPTTVIAIPSVTGKPEASHRRDHSLMLRSQKPLLDALDEIFAEHDDETLFEDDLPEPSDE